LASADDITSKALTLHNVQQSFHGTGAITIQGVMKCQADRSGLTTDPSDPLDILSGNAFFHSLDYERALKVVEAIPECAVLFGIHHIVPEDEFDRILGEIPGADNTKIIKKGNKERNDMNIGRQRFCILSNVLFEFRAARVVAKAAMEELSKNEAREKRQHDGPDDDGPAKKKASRKCSNTLCMEPMADGGSKCETTGCLLRFCATCLALPFYASHRKQCTVIQEKKKKEKKEKSGKK
jgi:hypothetical protein